MYRESGEVRTDMYCHNCNKNFVALLDYDLDGNHEIECPGCGHIHYRVIKSGVVTGDRYDSDVSGKVNRPRKTWKSNSVRAQTNSASHFIQQRWLEKGCR